MKKVSIENPLIYTSTVKPEEAERRQRAAAGLKRLEYTVIQEGPNGEQAPEGLVMGQTRVTRLQSLKAFNLRLEKIKQTNI